jgi:hypothetical protein
MLPDRTHLTPLFVLNHLDPDYVARLLNETAVIVERTRVAVEQSQRLLDKASQLQNEWQRPSDNGG